MIDTAVKVIDRLIELVKAKGEARAKYFDEIIEPLYQETEEVFRDYVALFRELIRRLEKDESVPDIIRWLEDRRLDFLPVRMKIRAGLDRFTQYGTLLHGEEQDAFLNGVWGVMKGALSLSEEGHTPMHEYGWGDHTVLDLLYIWSRSPVSVNRRRYLDNAHEQLASIERAWQDVVRGYYAHRDRLKLPRQGKIIKRANKAAGGDA